MATPTFIQHKGGGGSDNGTGVNAGQYFLPNPTLANNCIVLCLSWTDTDGTLSSITDDSGSNTWSTTAAVTVVSSTNVRSSIFVLANAASLKSITVNYSAVVGNFTMQVTEYNNIATTTPVDGTTSAADVAATALAAGSFTPTTNNDANGGHLIHAYFRCSIAGGNSSAPDHFTPGGSFNLLDGECNAGGSSASAFVQHTCEYFVQATNAAINPSVTANSQSVSDTYNCLAIALKAASAGTAYNSANGIHVRRILHFSNSYAAGAGTTKFVCPCDGNLRVFQICNDSATVVVSSVADTDGTYSSISNPNAKTYLFHLDNKTADNANLLTMTRSAGSLASGGSCRFFDIEFAATSPLGATNDQTITVGVNLRADDDPTLTPTQTGSLIIAGGPTSHGPILNNFDPSATNLTPAAAIFDLINYTGETDNDPIDNADACAHYYAPNTTTIHWNWVTGASGATVNVVSAEFKTAGGDVLQPQIVM